jgi:hypothetical protein
VAYSLITAPDERERCCVVIDGARCDRPTSHRISDGSWDGYTYTCMDHVALVLTDQHGCTVELVAR